MKRILIAFIILTILFTFSAFPHPNTISSESIQLPSGFSFSTDYQKIPVTLKGTTYYAYQIEKKENDKNIVGWLIVDSNNRIVSDADSYKKLSLAATVSKYTVKLNELSRMENEINLLSDIKGKLVLYEIAMPILKGIASTIGSIKTGKIPSGLIEESMGVIAFVPQALVTSLSDSFLNDFTEWVGNEIIQILVDTGELKGDVSDVSVLKVFGVLKVIIRKGALINFKIGFDQFNQAYSTLKSHKDPWSYEDASSFLTNYEQGEARAIAYSSWYLDLIPSSVWAGLWDNIFKQLLPEWLEKPMDFGINFKEWFPKVVKAGEIADFGYNKVVDDIKSIASGFMLYKSFYDLSISDSMASKVYGAIKTGLTGTLSITSNPTGAKVYIDDKYISNTPLKDYKLSLGTHSFKLAKEGYNDYTDTISITNTDETKAITITLTKALQTNLVKDYYFPSVKISININIDGSFDVFEERTYSFLGEYSWVTYNLQKSGFSSIENFSISDESGPYKRVDFDKQSERTFILTETALSYESKFYFSANNQTKTFTISYKVKGGIPVYTDVADFYWKLIGSGWNKKTQKLEAFVYLPSEVNPEDIKVFGHGPLNGIAERIGGKGGHFVVTDVPPNTYVEARVVFPSSILKVQRINQKKLEEIINEELNGG